MGKPNNNFRKPKKDYNNGFTGRQGQGSGGHYTKNREHGDRLTTKPFTRFQNQSEAVEFEKPVSMINNFVDAIIKLVNSFNEAGANIEACANNKKEKNGVILITLNAIKGKGENETVDTLLVYYAENQYLGKNPRPIKAYPAYAMITSQYNGTILFNTFGTSNVWNKTVQYTKNILSKNTGIEINDETEAEAEPVKEEASNVNDSAEAVSTSANSTVSETAEEVSETTEEVSEEEEAVTVYSDSAQE